MKKNLTIVIFALLCTSLIHAAAAEPNPKEPARKHVHFAGFPPNETVKLPPTSTTALSTQAEQVAKIVLAVKAINNAAIERSIQQQKEFLHTVLTQLHTKEYPYLADTKILDSTRNAINNAVQFFTQDFNDYVTKNVPLTIKDQQALDKVVQARIQSCYEGLIQDPSLMATLLPSQAAKAIGSHILNIKPELLKDEALKTATTDLLVRITMLWDVMHVLFNIPIDQSITLTKPSATMTIKQWITETERAVKKIDSTNISTAKGPEPKDKTTAKASIPSTKIAQKEIADQVKVITIMPPSAEKLQIADNLINNFAEYGNSKNDQLSHELFAKNNNQFFKLVIDAHTLLRTIAKILQKKEYAAFNDETLIAHNSFIQNMNELCAILFKSQFGGPIGSKFLVVKHKFNPKYRNSGSTTGIITQAYPEDSLALEIPNLPADQAVIALTALVMLWEIYQNLFANTKDLNLITLPYFNESYPVSNWIYYTTHAGFTQKAQFSTELQASLKPLLPEPKKWSLALKDSFTSLTTAVSEKAQSAGSWIANQLIKLKKSVARKAEKITEKIEDIPDEL